ncbi:MAG TPA: phosphatidylglycerophosphatase A [Bryobacteraceae bacterium]
MKTTDRAAAGSSTVRERSARLIATVLGCGYSPVAPGTAGSLAALAIAVPLHKWAGFSGWRFAALAALGFIPAVWASTRTARAVNAEDPGIVVVDEVIGQWISLAGAASLNWKTYLAAFALFRLFDIWKPAPVRQLEKLPEGLGIVADDAMAGIYAALVLFLAGWLNLK